MSDEEVGAATIERWLQPLPDDTQPCGPDLEYDNAMLALNQSAAGKPETQFGPGTPPDWPSVREQAEALFERTRDLRIALLWVRAMVRLEGFLALPQGLRLLHGLLERFWDALHPVPEDGDAFARMNTLALLREPDGLLGDVRQSTLSTQRGVGEIRVRSVEVALNLFPAREGEAALNRDQVAQMLEGAVKQDGRLHRAPESAMQHLQALSRLLDERVGTEAPDFRPLHAMIKAVASVMPSALQADAQEGQPESGTEMPMAADGIAPAASGRLAGTVRSREDAVRAIDMICEYLERAEPTNPAPLLLRRARRMINRNFLQLLKELAPDALAEVARVMGVDPETVSLDESS
ncbi:MAG TPA: type VI secretion system protein TssA [Burkholderiaceae bacterium]|nr:type VI secretion system protein TssA [Burkholderiaceae bacterium]